MATAEEQEIFDRDLRLKLELEAELEPQLREVNRAVAQMFLRNPSSFDAGAFHRDQIKPILLEHYEKVGAAFRESMNSRLPDDVKSTPEEKAAIAIALAAIFAQRADEQAQRIGDTTARHAALSSQIAIEDTIERRAQGELVGFRDERVVAAALLSRGLTGRLATTASFETEAPAERAKAAEVEELVPAESVVSVTKTWVTMGDEFVRDHHDAVSSMVVAFDQPFVVMGQEMMHPGDTSRGATAANVAHCRCSSVVDSGAVAEARR
jgi:hypothetical protein